MPAQLSSCRTRLACNNRAQVGEDFSPMSPLTIAERSSIHAVMCARQLSRGCAVEDTRSNPQLAEGGTLPLWRGLLLFVPLIFAGNLVGVFLRYPGHGSAIL